jgi:hypothetical protein
MRTRRTIGIMAIDTKEEPPMRTIVTGAVRGGSPVPTEALPQTAE